jgi:hypothetical protein
MHAEAVRREWLRHEGFSMMDLLVVAAFIGIVGGVSVPLLGRTIERMRLGMAARDVKSELQTARLKAVSSNTYMRVRFDCPSAGQFRVIERIGNPNVADAGDDLNSAAATRCSPTAYPVEIGAGGNRLVRPNNDEPLRTLQPGVSFSTTTGLTASANKVVEFWPDGSAHVPGGPPWPRVGTAGVQLVLTRDSQTRTLTVTSLGNIQ